MFIAPVVVAGLLTAFVEAKTREYNWTVGWKEVDPDGLMKRQVVAINDEWPLPVVRAAKGDRVVFRVQNNLTDPVRNSSIHFHGLFQNGTNDMDGPIAVTQCPTVAGSEFVYNFTVDQPGTYWYHTHVTDLYPDGYRQMFLVEDEDAWFEDEVDGELAFSLTDWYHELTQVISETKFQTRYNPTGAEPVPNSLLFNDTIGPKYLVKPGKTYRLRIANTAALSSFYFYIAGHNVTIVEVDGVFTEPASAAGIYITPAQRYSVLFTVPHNAHESEAFQMAQIADADVYDVISPDLKLNQTAWLHTGEGAVFTEITHEDIYNSGLVDRDAVTLEDFDSSDIVVFDDFYLTPYDRQPLLPEPDREIVLDMDMGNLGDGKPYAFFAAEEWGDMQQSWTPAKVPTLYTVLDAPDDETALNATIYGSNTNTIVLNHLEVAQIVLNNADDGMHPFHIHGHNFQLILRGKEYEEPTRYDAESPDNLPLPEIPVKRDTVYVNGNSHFVIRFRADNPGVWLMHCHVDWHLTQGLALQFVEAPVQVRQNYKVHRTIPNSSWESCRLSGMPTRGNAAANTKDFFNLKGENRQYKYLPEGFTLKGYILMGVSVIMAFVGMGFLSWLALSDTKEDEALYFENISQEPVNPREIEREQFQQRSSESGTPLLADHA